MSLGLARLVGSMLLGKLNSPDLGLDDFERPCARVAKVLIGRSVEVLEGVDQVRQPERV